jgi:hypothetical protein
LLIPVIWVVATIRDKSGNGEENVHAKDRQENEHAQCIGKKTGAA